MPAILHTLLFAIYPVLFMYFHNISEVPFTSCVTALIIYLSIALFTFFILNLFIKEKIKSALISSIIIILFFNFYFFITLFSENIYTFFLLINILATIIYLVFLIVRTKNNLIKTNSLVNYISIILILLSFTEIPLNFFTTVLNNKNEVKEVQTQDIKNNYPDIYYLVFDAYGNEKALKKYLDFDNSKFLNKLEQEGFYIAHNSTSNYPLTYYSLTSSLAMNYIHNKIPNTDNFNLLSRNLINLRKNSELFKILKNNNYELTFISNCLILMDLKKLFNSDKSMILSNNGFYYILYKNTIFNIIYSIENSNYLNRNKVNNFNKIIDSVVFPSKKNKFVMLHILAPHPPFLYKKNGTLNTNSEACTANTTFCSSKKNEYNGFLEYTNQLILNITNNIKKSSKKDFIIIIQGDHGARYLKAIELMKFLKHKKFKIDYNDLTNLNTENIIWENVQYFTPSDDNLKERFGILNAYYFSNKDLSDKIPQNISPVNTFRIISNEYFDTNYQMLPNKNYNIEQGTKCLNKHVEDVTQIVQPFYSEK